jgi:hypothetical protein
VTIIPLNPEEPELIPIAESAQRLTIGFGFHVSSMNKKPAFSALKARFHSEQRIPVSSPSTI